MSQNAGASSGAEPLLIRKTPLHRNSQPMNCGKRLACPCLNLHVNLVPNVSYKSEEWKNEESSPVFSKSQLKHTMEHYPSVKTSTMDLLGGSSIAGVQASIDIFMESHVIVADDEQTSNVKVFRCLNCETFFGFFLMKEQVFLVNSSELMVGYKSSR